MKNSTFANTANAITSTVINTVRAELNEEREKVFERLDETESSILNALVATSVSGLSSTDKSIDDTSSISDITGKANATTGSTVQLEILKILKTIQEDMKECHDDGGDKDNGGGKKKRDVVAHVVRMFPNTAGPVVHGTTTVKTVLGKNQGIKMMPLFKTRWAGALITARTVKPETED